MTIPPAEFTFTALVPMRHHSARVEGKNYRMMAGRPLFTYILDTLLSCKRISKIVVDTDSPVIREGLREGFPQVEVLPRPSHLTADDVPMNEILLHDIQQVHSDFYLQTHTTNPLLTSTTIEKAIESFTQAWPGKDSLFSVTPFQTRLWTSEAKPVNHDPTELIPTQDLEPLFIENSCLYIFPREGLIEHQHRIGKSPILFEIEPDEAVDIDTEWDFALAEVLLTKQQTRG